LPTLYFISLMFRVRIKSVLIFIANYTRSNLVLLLYATTLPLLVTHILLFLRGMFRTALTTLEEQAEMFDALLSHLSLLTSLLHELPALLMDDTLTTTLYCRKSYASSA